MNARFSTKGFGDFLFENRRPPLPAHRFGAFFISTERARTHDGAKRPPRHNCHRTRDSGSRICVGCTARRRVERGAANQALVERRPDGRVRADDLALGTGCLEGRSLPSLVASALTRASWGGPTLAGAWAVHFAITVGALLVCRSASHYCEGRSRASLVHNGIDFDAYPFTRKRTTSCPSSGGSAPKSAPRSPHLFSCGQCATRRAGNDVR